MNLLPRSTENPYECVEWKDDLALHLRSVLPVVHGGHPQDSSWAIAGSPTTATGIVIFLQGQQQDPSFDMNQQPIIQRRESGSLRLFGEFREGSCAGAGPPTMSTGIGIFSQSPQQEPPLYINQQPIMQEKRWRSPPLSGEPQESFCGGPGSPAIAIRNDQSSHQLKDSPKAPCQVADFPVPLLALPVSVTSSYICVTGLKLGFIFWCVATKSGVTLVFAVWGGDRPHRQPCKLPSDGLSETANHCGVRGGRMPAFPLLDVR